MKRFFWNARLMAVAVCLLCGFLSACSDDDENSVSSQSSNLGEVTVDCDRIGAWQPITITCPYTSGSNLYTEEIYAVSPEGISSAVTPKDGRLTASYRGRAAGQHTFAFRIVAIGNDAQQYTVEKSVDVTVQPADFRCHFWGETREETLRNLSFYTTTIELSEGGTLCVQELDRYGSGIDYSREVGMWNNIGWESSRYVYYYFTDDGKLRKIGYSCDPSTPGNTDYVAELTRHIAYVKVSEGLELVNCSWTQASGYTATEAERTMADQFVAAVQAGERLKDESGTLTQAIADDNIRLTADFKNATTYANITIRPSEKGVYVYMDFSPLAD